MVKQLGRKRFLWSKQGLLFLLFASVIWTINTLSKSYSTLVPVTVKLHASGDAVLLLAPSLDVQAQMTASGFSILYRKTFPRLIRLDVSQLPELDLNNPRLQSLFLVDVYKQQYPSANDVERFIPLSIPLPLARAAKRSFIPELNNSIILAEGYQLTAPLRIAQDSVYAVAAASVLDSIVAAVFDLSTDVPLKEDFRLRAYMPDSLSRMARWSSTHIDVSGTVDRYSAISFDLPVVLTQVPDSLRLALSPKQVKVKFAAPLAELKAINASSLTAEATYSPNDSGVLTIRVTGLPPTAKQLIVTPSSVNYLIVE